MSHPAIARPLPRATRVTALAMLLSAVAGLLITAAVAALFHPGGGDRHAAPATPFTLSIPHGWRALSASELANTPGRPSAVLKRGDGRGIVVIRRAKPFHATGAELMQGLGHRLRPRFHGFRVVSARFANLRGGRAFLYTFTRDPNATVQTVALTGVHGQAYEIDAVVPAGARDAAREVGAAIGSFGP